MRTRIDERGQCAGLMTFVGGECCVVGGWLMDNLDIIPGRRSISFFLLTILRLTLGFVGNMALAGHSVGLEETQ